MVHVLTALLFAGALSPIDQGPQESVVESPPDFMTRLTALEFAAKEAVHLDTCRWVWRDVMSPTLRFPPANTSPEAKSRLVLLRNEVAERFESTLREAADKALVEAKSVDQLAPVAEYEDLLFDLRALRVEFSPESSTQNLTRRLAEHMRASDARMRTFFDVRRIGRLPWIDLIETERPWTGEGQNSQLVRKFESGLVLRHEGDEDAGSAGMVYAPGRGWRDYFVDLDLTLESGALVVGVRVSPADALTGTSFTIALERDVGVTRGIRSRFEVKVIGNQLSVARAGDPVLTRTISLTKARQGGLYLGLRPGTSVTIHSLRARLLR